MYREYLQAETRKKYKRFRGKWLIFLFLLGVLLAVSGIRREEPEKVPEQAEPVPEKSDLEYLEESPDIRVILQAGNYNGLFHDRVEVCFEDGGYVLTEAEAHWQKHEIAAGETVSVGIGTDYTFSVQDYDEVVLLPGREDGTLTVTSLQRNRESASYRGRLEVTLESAGLLLVNVLPLEEYLYGVVPSEMPASFSEEALKAQAVLARTYAYKYLIHPAYPEYQAHLDDSITYQVYGNLDENANTQEAVKETAGILLFHGEDLAEVYYYSTSCGFGTDGEVWGGDGQEYLKAARIGPGTLQTASGALTGEEAEKYYLESLQDEEVFRTMISSPLMDGYECEIGWYRWQALEIPAASEAILTRLKERWQAKPEVILTRTKNGSYVSKAVASLGTIQDMYISERGAGGVSKSLIIVGSEHTYQVLLEYNIRYVLAGNGVTVEKQDGTESHCSTLLPSGFFYLDTIKKDGNVISYSIHGGGYGHGVGMSQNGADRMAEQGFSFSDILTWFFPDTEFISYEENYNDTNEAGSGSQ